MQVIAQMNGADEAQLAALARMMAASARPGQTILLDGPVGAGKSHFARAFIRARQGDAAEDVPSPTFTLVQTYDDPMGTEIWHADLYRLTDPSELDELGLDEALGNAICLIEWPDRLEQVPPGALWLRLVPTLGGAARDVSLSGQAGDWPDLARAVQRARFVAGAGWAEARVQALAGDASSRRYFRLAEGARTAILMDDPPPGSLPAYLTMTDWLRARGFGAPQVLAADPAQGLMLAEDLGDDLVARMIADDPALAPAIYARITDLLVDLQSHAPPDHVLPLDADALADLTALFAQWYLPAVGGQGGDAIAGEIARLYRDLAGDAPLALSLRDFHAENLIWRGEAPLGILDFQDAVAAHPAYDLVSALQDARRDVDPALEAAMIGRFIAATGADPDAFRAIYALLGAQRALRILGIFARLVIRDGKPRYLAFVPRVWGYLMRDLDHPALAGLRAMLADVPAPTPEVLERISAKCPTR